MVRDVRQATDLEVEGRGFEVDVIDTLPCDFGRGIYYSRVSLFTTEKWALHVSWVLLCNLNMTLMHIRITLSNAMQHEVLVITVSLDCRLL